MFTRVDFHTSLFHFIAAFEQTGSMPPFRVKREYPIVPGGANLGDRAACRTLVERLVQAGQISAEDGEYVTSALSSVAPRLTDYV
jgi:hypothetical protein